MKMRITTYLAMISVITLISCSRESITANQIVLNSQTWNDVTKNSSLVIFIDKPSKMDVEKSTLSEVVVKSYSIEELQNKLETVEGKGIVIAFLFSKDFVSDKRSYDRRATIREMDLIARHIGAKDSVYFQSFGSGNRVIENN